MGDHFYYLNIKNELADEDVELLIEEGINGEVKKRKHIIKPNESAPRETFNYNKQKILTIHFQKGNKPKYYITHKSKALEGNDILFEVISAFPGVHSGDTSYKAKYTNPRTDEPKNADDGIGILQTNDNVTIGDKEP